MFWSTSICWQCLFHTWDLIPRVVSGQLALGQRPEVAAARCPEVTPGEEKTQEVMKRLAAAEDIRRWKLQNWSCALELDGVFFTRTKTRGRKAPQGLIRAVCRDGTAENLFWVVQSSLWTQLLSDHADWLGAKTSALDVDKQQISKQEN